MKKSNFWPLIIVVVFLPFTAGIIATVVISQDNPVSMDNRFLSNYHTVDKNYNDLMAKQSQFEKDFNASFVTTSFHEGANELVLHLAARDGGSVDNAKIEALLTRPHTDAMDQNLTFKSAGDGMYKTTVTIPAAGRWQVKAKVLIGDHSGMIEREYKFF